jgi:hypothetical protein
MSSSRNIVFVLTVYVLHDVSVYVYLLLRCVWKLPETNLPSWDYLTERKIVFGNSYLTQSGDTSFP